MNSIAIVEITVPNSCHDCDISFSKDKTMQCHFITSDVETYKESRHPDCPLIIFKRIDK